MKTLFLQSLSGSIVLLFLLAVWIPAGKRGLYRWLDRLLRVCVAFFLLPLPLLKGICERGLMKLNMNAPWLSLFMRENVHYRISVRTPVVITNGDEMMLNRAFWIWLAVSGILILGAIVVFSRKLYHSVKVRRAAFGRASREEADGLQEWMEEEGKRLRLKRLPGIYLEQEGIGAFAVGIIRPDVMLPAQADSKERRLILLHELCHIRRRDVLIKTFIVAAVCLHWFNPLVYALPVLFRRGCELCCDGLVRDRLAPEERKVYAHLLVKQATKTKKEMLLGQIAFGEGKRLTEERVTFIMKEKKEMRMVKWVATLASVVTIAVAALPVWAYEFPPVIQGEASTIRALNEEEGFELRFSTTEEGLYPMPIVEYEYQFMDEDGKVYEVNPFAPKRSGCSHAQTSPGTYQEHKKNGDGSCNIISYQAKRCLSCGAVIKGEMTRNTYSPKCTH